MGTMGVTAVNTPGSFDTVGDVRIHTAAKTAQAAATIDARAFPIGKSTGAALQGTYSNHEKVLDILGPKSEARDYDAQGTVGGAKIQIDP